MQWFDKTPYGPNPTLRQEIAWDVHRWGRQTFASNYAQGGVSASLFAPTKQAAMQARKTTSLEYGSPKHISNLEFMQSQYPNDAGIEKALDKARKGVSQKGGKAGLKALGNVARVGFVAAPLFMTPGGINEKARAMGESVASGVGWDVGGVAGRAVGAGIGGTIGSFILPGVGTGIGAAVGSVVGYFAGGIAGAGVGAAGYNATLGIADRAVERERSRRQLNWKNDMTAFMTQNAHTMRQQSLQAMNRGMMSARSMLGREGVMLHQ